MPNVTPRRFRALDCFGGYHGCELVFVPTNGRQKACPACKRSERLEYFRTPEHAARKRQWRAENPERNRAHTRRAYERAKARPKVPRSPAEIHDRSLRVRHRISLAGKVEILRIDGGVCLVCRVTVSDIGDAVVDHDHGCCPAPRSCGSCIRGVIHQFCNARIARLENAGQPHPYLVGAAERMRRNDEIRKATHAQRVTAEMQSLVSARPLPAKRNDRRRTRRARAQIRELVTAIMAMSCEHDISSLVVTCSKCPERDSHSHTVATSGQ